MVKLGESTVKLTVWRLTDYLYDCYDGCIAEFVGTT